MKTTPEFSHNGLGYSVDKAYPILKKDPVMKAIIRATGPIEVKGRKDVYGSLIRSITSQQLSVKAANTIYQRFLDLFPKRNPLPELVLATDIQEMRSSGLSQAKSQYLKNIARFSLEEGLGYQKLNRMDDEELIAYLTRIKGVGHWTAEMVLMFTMNRPDLLPVDDLGIRQSMKHHYRLKGEGRLLTGRMLKTAEVWRPYRTLACLHLWRIRNDGGI